MTGIDSTNPRQPFEQIADYYRAEIESQRLPAGSQLPSVREIAARFGVAAGTVNGAIKALKDAGLVMSWQGKGVFVRDLRTDIDPDGVDSAEAYETIIARLDEIQKEMQELSGRVSDLEHRRQQKER